MIVRAEKTRRCSLCRIPWIIGDIILFSDPRPWPPICARTTVRPTAAPEGRISRAAYEKICCRNAEKLLGVTAS